MVVKDQFPIEGKKNTLQVNKVWVDDNKDIDDIRSQKQAKLKDQTWSVPVRAEVELVDNKTGKVKDRQAVTVAQLPKVTNRYTYIVNGNEYQVNNQFRLKSGVYTRVKDNGDIASQWNLAKGLGFEMNFDPKTKKMTMKHQGKNANIALYPILKEMGVDDDTIERRWGKEILSANQKEKHDVALKKFYKSMTGENPESMEEAREKIKEEMERTVLRPDSTKVTLGTPYDKVTGSALLDGSHKILRVSRQEEKTDDRDSLRFKDLMSAEDLLVDRFERNDKWNVRRKISNNVDKKTKVKEIINPEQFGKPIRSFFSSSNLSSQPDQMNPMSYISGNRRTTVLGEGGIGSIHQVTDAAKLINPSHMGFLDPIQTPESAKIGTTLQLSLGAEKRGKDLKVRAYNTKTKKTEWIDPATALTSNVAYPDQYEMKNGEMKPVGRLVKISDKEGTTILSKPSDVDYVLKSSKGMFDLSANMIPFLQNNQGNRTMVAAKQIEQAVALKDREQPKVQVRSDTPATWEQLVGSFVSHMSPVAGKVEKIKKDGVVIRGDDGKRHEVQLYDDFPLNDDKSVINSTPIVKKGDQVKAGQPVADTNFTKDGTLALGTNLRVAYMPYQGYNFEDGIVISDSAAKKLTSEHMFRNNVQADKNTVLNKKKFLAQTAGQVTREQADKLDDNAVIMEGQRVEPGDVIIGALRKELVTPEQQMLGLFSKKRLNPMRARDTRWEKDAPGTVTRVVKHGKKTTVYIKADAPADIGDKIVGRHGNKGIITNILPDHEMPKDKDGNAVQVLLNPTGVPTRINLGQVLETAASKISDKKGKPYVVNNFDPSKKDYTRDLQDELKKAGISDTEELFDPNTNKSLGKVLTGDQYIYKLHHTAEKGLSVRSRHAYDSNMAPRKGGPHGAQTMDAMGLYAMLAHNARENVREMQSYKSDKNDEFWVQLQSGSSIPTPKIPFVWKKFEGYLKGMGLDVQKDGNDLFLAPLTDKKTLAMSNGELKRPSRALQGSKLKPEKGGIFDPDVTGTKWPEGHLGGKWSHIKLESRMPNPVFETPVQSLLGLKKKQFSAIINGKEELDGKTGPEAIISKLKQIDIDGEMKNIQAEIPKLRTNKLNDANKKLKYLNALKRAGMKPTEAYTMRHLPVLPPTMRPVMVRDDGQLNLDDLNRIYQLVGATNDQIKTFDPALPPEEKTKLESTMYDGLKSLTMSGVTSHGKQLKGIAGLIAGASPKEGFFQSKIIGRRQDLSMRSTIVPEPSLSLDEVGIPHKAARELYKPFVVQSMVRSGYRPLQAQKEVKESTIASDKHLEKVVNERPLLLKRDPVLHKFGVQAFKPRLTDGKAIKIHPLATSGYNADFDGDKMAAFVPVSPSAVREASKMVPSHNLFSPSTGSLMFKPEQEAMLGLYKLTEMGKDKGKKFDNLLDAVKATKNKEIDLNEVIDLSDINKDPLSLLKEGAPKKNKTTMGRLMVYHSLPEKVRDERILYDPAFNLNKKSLNDLLTRIAKDSTGDFGWAADRLKDIGNEHSTGLSISLKDFESDSRFRDSLMAAAAKEETKIRNSRASSDKKAEKIVNLYSKVSATLDKEGKKRMDKKTDNRMYDWIKSGARGKWDNFKQMTLAPVLVADSSGKPVPVPINKSYSEGLDIGSYWASMHGARMGTIGRVEGTWRPGLMSKQLIQTTMNQMVVDEDCGTSKGIILPVDNRDILDRYTSRAIKLGTKGGKEKGTIPAGTLITPDVVNRLRNNKVSEVRVRSPLKCEHGDGMCGKCYGLNENGEIHNPGTNVGVMAAHALGEPATQLSMNAFHCNHSDSLVFVRRLEGEPYAVTMEDFFESMQVDVEVEGDEEIKDLSGANIETLSKEGWVPVTHVRRHAPSRPMRMLSGGGLVTICQDNHPVAVWQNAVQCESCGYHRLKKNGTRAVCPSCKKAQRFQERKPVGQVGYLPPTELDPKRFFLHKNLKPVISHECTNDIAEKYIGEDPWVVGMFLAEGCVTFKRSHARMQEKKPYALDFAQNDGPIKDKLVLALEASGHGPRVYTKRVIVNSLALGAKFHSLFGRYAHKKSLPPRFIQFDLDWLRRCLAGIIDGDGTVERHKDGPDTIGIDTTSFELAQQVAFVAIRLGIDSSIVATTIGEITRKQGFKVRLRMTPLACALLEDSIKVTQIEKKSLTSGPPSIEKHVLLTLNREILYDEPYVYDLTTESGTLYVGGLLSHNTGGVVGAKGTDAINVFTRLEQLLNVPKKLPGSATLAQAEGKIEQVKKDEAGGWSVYIHGQRHYVPGSRKLKVKKGDLVRRGDAISSGPKNPMEMLPLTNINSVQRYLTDEIQGTYESVAPIRRRNTETFVRAMTNLSEVLDPGDHEDVIRGDRMPTSEINKFNRNLPKGKKSVVYRPMLKGVNQLPLELQTDWIARLQSQKLKGTLIDAAAEGWRSALHSTNPVPGMAYGKEFGKGTEEAPWLY